jgi:hypothetical protein
VPKRYPIRIPSFTQFVMLARLWISLTGATRIHNRTQTGLSRFARRIGLTLEAEAYAEANRGDAALQAIEKALFISKDTGKRWAWPRCCG